MAEETLIITVSNSQPTVAPFSDSIQISEFTSLGVIYTINATDTDGDTLTYTLQSTDGVSRNFFWINPTDGSVMLQRALTTVSTNRFVVSFYFIYLEQGCSSCGLMRYGRLLSSQMWPK